MMDMWMDAGQMHRQMNDRWMSGQTDAVWVDGQMDGDGWRMYGWVDGWKDG